MEAKRLQRASQRAHLEKFLASLRCTFKSEPVSDSDGDIQIKVTFLGGGTLPTFHHIWLNKYVFELGLFVSGFTLCSHIIKFGLQCHCQVLNSRSFRAAFSFLMRKPLYIVSKQSNVELKNFFCFFLPYSSCGMIVKSAMVLLKALIEMMYIILKSNYAIFGKKSTDRMQTFCEIPSCNQESLAPACMLYHL